MKYEELKNDVIRELTSHGFVLENDILTATQVQQHQVIINGESSVQEEKRTVQLTILGEGAIDNEPAIGLNIRVGSRDMGDYWMTCIEDLKLFS